MKSIALLPLAAVSVLIVLLAQDWVRPRLNAQLGWDPRSGFDFDLKVAIELPLGLAF